MAKGTRKSQSISAGITELQYNESLAKYATNSAKLKGIEADMEEQINAIRQEFEDDINIMSKEQALLLAVIKGYCIQNRESLFIGKKSRETLYGLLGFRKATPSLKTLKGKKWDEVLELVKELLPAYVRTAEELDKEKLLADREKEGVADKLAQVGVQVSQDENFFIELKTESVSA